MSLVGTLNDFSRAMRMTRFLILILVLVAAAGMYAFSAINNFVNYTEVRARVERVAVLCRASGTPIAAAVDCAAPGAGTARGKTIRNAAVYVRYTSPADGRERQGRIVAGGKSQISKVKDLRPGDVLTIWAHDNEPDQIKIH